MTHPLTHDGRPARYRVQYADGEILPGQAADSLFADLLEAHTFLLDTWCELPDEDLVIVEFDRYGRNDPYTMTSPPRPTHVDGLGTVAVYQVGDGRFHVYTQDEWRDFSGGSSKHIADTEGRITFQGQPTGYRLTREQMDAAR